jgi:2-oxoglutarate/2-oxoacid ferredoxin oxidoreductase subunit beta
VVVFSGDGDLFAIGGNHFIHAARRNMDLTVICLNNLNYGMTGGQVAATTPFLAKTTTTPVGQPGSTVQPAAAGLGFGRHLCRALDHSAHPRTDRLHQKALLKSGFSFIEVLGPCPVNYGRRNREKSLQTLKMYRSAPSSATMPIRPIWTSISPNRWFWASSWTRSGRRVSRITTRPVEYEL